MAATMGPDCESDTDERELAESAGQDPQAFARLYDRYFPRVYAYVLYRVGHAQSSEDLVADTFLKAVEALGRGQFRWRHGGSFASWLFRIAHNSVADYHRHNRGYNSAVPLDELPELQSDRLLPEEGVLQRERFAHLRSLLGTLSPRRQEIITLKFFGGLHNSEIAAVLGLDERTVASHLCRGLRDLHGMYLEGPGPYTEKYP